MLFSITPKAKEVIQRKNGELQIGMKWFGSGGG